MQEVGKRGVYSWEVDLWKHFLFESRNMEDEGKENRKIVLDMSEQSMLRESERKSEGQKVYNRRLKRLLAL